MCNTAAADKKEVEAKCRYQSYHTYEKNRADKTPYETVFNRQPAAITKRNRMKIQSRGQRGEAKFKEQLTPFLLQCLIV